MAEKITVERLAANFAEEFFSRRCDAFEERVEDHHRSALAKYFANFAAAILTPDPDGVTEVDTSAFVRDRTTQHG